LEECKAAGITASYARTIGIAVDHRRKNKSEESLTLNADRLKEYLGKVIVFPKKRLSAPKKGDAGPELTKAATQLVGTVLPIAKAASAIEMADVTDDMKAYKAFTTMRLAKKETKVDGFRASVANRKKD